MKVRLLTTMGYALVVLALMGGAAIAATGTPLGETVGCVAVALALAVWFVRTWALAPDMTPTERYAQVIVPAMAMLVLVPMAVFATSGTASGMGATTAGDGDFGNAYERVRTWATGDLGRLVTVGLLVTGVSMGIVRQSVMAAVPAAGAGLALSLGPGVIETIFAATL